MTYTNPDTREWVCIEEVTQVNSSLLWCRCTSGVGAEMKYENMLPQQQAAEWFVQHAVLCGCRVNTHHKHH
jgi:hypothetical protein